MTKINSSFINKIKNPASLFLIIFIIFSLFTYPQKTTAATNVISAMSDTMTRQKVGVASAHTIKFKVSQAVQTASDTIVITFPSDFTFASKTIGTITALTHGQTTGLETTETNPLQASPTTSVWGAAFSGSPFRVLTLTVPTDGVGIGAVIANDYVIVTMNSSNAINGTTAVTYLVTIATTGSNPSVAGSAVFAITLLAEDTVSVSATVNPSLTWTLSNPTVSFGTLSSSAHNASAATTFSVGTNGSGGYAVRYYGTTPTNGQRAMNVNSTGDTATVGVELFGINLVYNGTIPIGSDPTGSIGTTSDAYKYSNEFAFAPGTASSQTTVVSYGTPIATGNYTISFLENISAVTPPGAYTGSIIFICTGTF